MVTLLRTLALLFGSWRRRSRLGVNDLSSLRMRAWPADLDIARHVNNGAYLSLMDLGRLDLLLRSGSWQRMRAAGVWPVVRSSTITYRKSIQPWQRFTLQTKVVGWDERSVFVEQRFVVRGEIWARGIMRGSFIHRGEGGITMARFLELTGIEADTFPPSPQLERWATEVALPSTRAEAPNRW